MPEVEGLRIRSLDSDAPRIDQIETPHEPAVPGAVASLASMSGEQLAKMDGDEAASMIGDLIDHMEGVAEEIAEDDPDMGKMLGEGAATLKRLLAEKMGEGEEPREGDEEPMDEEEYEQESAKLLGRFRALEAGRVLSNKNLSIVREFIKALKAALKMAKGLESAAAPRATEAAIGAGRALEAIEVLDADFGEFEDGKPYVKAYCVFARAGKSANVGPDGRRRSYCEKAAKRLAESGAYDNVPHYPRHLSNREIKEHPDGMRELIEGWTGPPEARPEETAHWHEASKTIRGWLYITNPARVAQLRADTSAGFSLKQLLKLSHDARFGSGDVRLTKASDGERIAELKNWRVASVDGATTPGLSGSGVLRQVAAYQGEGSPMSDNKTPAPGPLADRIAEIEARKTYLADAKRLIEAVTDNEDVRDKAYRYVESASDPIDATDIEAKVADLAKPKAATPKADVHRSTESKIEGGKDRREILTEHLANWFDVRGLIKGKDGRSAESFNSFDQFMYAAFSGTDAFSERQVESHDIAKVLHSSEVYDMHLGRRATESRGELTDERATEAYREADADLRTNYTTKLGGHRAAEAITTTGVAQIVADAKHQAALPAYAAEVDGHDATFPPLSIVVSQREVIDDIGETHRFIRWQKLGASEAAAVGEGAPYLEATNAADEEETGSLAKRGFYVDITIEALSRDKTGLLQRAPQMIFEALGAQKYRLGMNVLTANPTLNSDSTAVAAAGHSNVVTTAMSYANVSTLMANMRQQTAYSTGTGANQIHLPIIAKHLVVADGLYAQALEQFSHESDPRTANRAASAIVNPGTPSISIWSLPLLDSASNADDYWLIADGSQVPLQAELVWSGQPEPRVFEANTDTNGVMFSNDLVRMKGRLFTGFVPLDYRGFAAGIVP